MVGCDVNLVEGTLGTLEHVDRFTIPPMTTYSLTHKTGFLTVFAFLTPQVEGKDRKKMRILMISDTFDRKAHDFKFSVSKDF